MKRPLSVVAVFALVAIVALCFVANSRINASRSELQEYSAHEYFYLVNSGSRTDVKSIVYTAANKMRFDSVTYLDGNMSHASLRKTIIVRDDLDLTWVCVEGESSCDEFQGGGMLHHMSYMITSMISKAPMERFQSLGPDVVNGIYAEKYIPVDQIGRSRDATIWMDANRIVVQFDVVTRAEDGSRKSRTHMELRDLERGRQPDELFERPSGMTAAPWPENRAPDEYWYPSRALP